MTRKEAQGRPMNDWLPIANADFRNWGPWVFHGEKAKSPLHVRTSVTREFEPDVVIYLTRQGHGWGRNYSPHWGDIVWYRLRCSHPYYRALIAMEGEE